MFVWGAHEDIRLDCGTASRSESSADTCMRRERRLGGSNTALRQHNVPYSAGDATEPSGTAFRCWAGLLRRPLFPVLSFVHHLAAAFPSHPFPFPSLPVTLTFPSHYITDTRIFLPPTFTTAIHPLSLSHPLSHATSLWSLAALHTTASCSLLTLHLSFPCVPSFTFDLTFKLFLSSLALCLQEYKATQG